MPTITTTVTSAAASGVVTTVTSTEATPEPEPAAVAVLAPKLEGVREGKCLLNVFGAEHVTSFPADAGSVSKE